MLQLSYFCLFVLKHIFSFAEHLHVLAWICPLGCVSDGAWNVPLTSPSSLCAITFLFKKFFYSSTCQLRYLFSYLFIFLSMGLTITNRCKRFRKFTVNWGHLMVYQSISRSSGTTVPSSQEPRQTTTQGHNFARRHLPEERKQKEHRLHPEGPSLCETRLVLQFNQLICFRLESGSVPFPQGQHPRDRVPRWQLAVTEPTRFLTFLVGVATPLASQSAEPPPRWAPLNGREMRKCVWPFYNVLERRSPRWPDPGWFI